MRVLVTGGAGFIGSHLIRALLDRGDAVTVLDNFDPAYDTEIKLANIAGLPIQLVEGDVRDRAAVEEALRVDTRKDNADRFERVVELV